MYKSLIGQHSIVLLITAFVWSFSLCAKADSLDVSPTETLKFPDVVDSIKSSIGLVSVPIVGTHLTSNGTGFVAFPMGNAVIFVTCRHTLFDSVKVGEYYKLTDTSHITVKFHNGGSPLNADLVAEREDKDIAILRVRISKSAIESLRLHTVLLGESKSIRDGADIACTGYDLLQKSERLGVHYDWPTTHRGIISSSRWEQVDSTYNVIAGFQADIVVNGGASGSPVYDPNSGSVLGMICSYQAAVSKGVETNAGIANCVPASYIAGLMRSWAQAQLEAARGKNKDGDKNN